MFMPTERKYWYAHFRNNFSVMKRLINLKLIIKHNNKIKIPACRNQKTKIHPC